MAEACFVSHIARTHWVATEGYALALGESIAAAGGEHPATLR
ncbi:hypothetical protein AAG604_04135 [Citromicrobium bathyomarinum]